MRLSEFLDSKLGQVALEALRWGLFVGVAAVVSKALELLAGVEQSSSVVLLTFALRFADSALHKSGIAEKGLSRF